MDVPHRDGIAIGERVVFLGGPIPTSLRCEPGAEIVIGGRTIWNYGARVTARSSVRIGTDCMIASHVYICDDDGRRSGPVTIGSGAWLAHGAVIEPGTVIGDGTVVAAMSVASGVVPPRSLVAGNPAYVLPLEASPEIAGSAPLAVLDEAVRAAVIEWLDDTRCFGDAEERVTSDSMSLREAGLLDSYGLVQLIKLLEKRFGVSIDRNVAVGPRIYSLEGLVDCVNRSGGMKP
jgi:maltose O-acetyltransferase